MLHTLIVVLCLLDALAVAALCVALAVLIPSHNAWAPLACFGCAYAIPAITFRAVGLTLKCW
jgi:hypothetical protein